MYMVNFHTIFFIILIHKTLIDLELKEEGVNLKPMSSRFSKHLDHIAMSDPILKLSPTTFILSTVLT